MDLPVLNEENVTDLLMSVVCRLAPMSGSSHTPSIYSKSLRHCERNPLAGHLHTSHDESIGQMSIIYAHHVKTDDCNKINNPSSNLNTYNDIEFKPSKDCTRMY